MTYIQKYVFQIKQKTNIKVFNIVISKNQTKTFHGIENANSVVQHVIQIKYQIIKHVNVNVKIILHEKRS